MTIDKATMTRAEDIARQIGTEHGETAASWFEVADRAAAVRLREMLDDGDPQAWDHIPAPDLSGQWADGFTPDALVIDIGREMDDEGGADLYSHQADVSDELCDAYCDAFNDAVMAEVERVLAAELADDDHQHQWGEVETSRFAGTPNRKCQVPGCREITLDLSDADPFRVVAELTYNADTDDLS